MPDTVKLGALDLCRCLRGVSPNHAIASSISLAPALERCGYSRYWLAEHHEPDIAHSCPEVLIAVLAGLTDRMRIGSAGVLLRYYAPTRVGKVFRLLEVLYPGRIDLGIAGGVASDTLIDELLRGRQTQVENYHFKVKELVNLLNRDGMISVNPSALGSGPSIWLLGAGAGSSGIAAECGAALCLGLSSGQPIQNLKTALKQYQEWFEPSLPLPSPLHAIAVAGVCNEDERRAREIAAVPAQFAPTVVGTPRDCAEQLLTYADEFGTCDLVFIDLSWIPDERLEAYGLLAEAVNAALGGRGLDSQQSSSGA